MGFTRSGIWRNEKRPKKGCISLYRRPVVSIVLIGDGRDDMPCTIMLLWTSVGHFFLHVCMTVSVMLS
jgi:hypothetical protein